MTVLMFYGQEGMKLEIMSISDVQLSECRLYSSEGLDSNNLEKCTGGRCNASFRIAYKSHQDKNLQIEEIGYCEHVDFDVADYKEGKFIVKITNKRLTL